MSVSIKKLTKRMRREAAASPKKAAALGLLLLAAIYFWMPLIRGMIAKGDVAPSKMSVAKDELPDAQFDPLALQRGAAEPAVPGEQAKPSYDWQQVAQWMEEDQATRPAALAERIVKRPSPFQPVVAEVAPVEPPEEVAQPVAPAATPDSLGMKLTATVVGPGRSVAVIDGRAYARGESVESVNNGEVIQFELSEVLPQRIVLEREGRRFELVLPERPMPRGIELAQ